MSNTLFIFRGTTQKRIFDKVDEKGPYDFLYGYDKFSETKNYLIATRGKRKTFIEKILYFVEKPFAFFVKLGFPLEIFPLFKTSIKESSYIFCVNDAIGFGLLFYKMCGIVDAKIIVLAQSLPERLKYFYWNRPLIWFVSKMLSSADKVMTLSSHAQQPFKTTFGIPQSKLSTFYFGVDVDYWSSYTNAKRENFILSIGNDMNRDFETLIAALPENMSLKIITRQKVRTQNKKVEILNDISDSELRKLYQTAFFVVIPSKRLEYESSGLSCILQSMACGAPVIASYAPTLNELFKDVQEISYYQPEDQVCLREKIKMIQSDDILRRNLAEAGREMIINKYNTKNMARQLEAIIEE